ncbi:MAG: thioredoxin domain-containing protein [Bacteroidetes bacterium]|nr:thioredoxin domain-containing protein [Bacteroidota bacterium]
MNQLAGETSPYLLQHANNPVHWMPWSDAAFQLAEEQQKPILLSIGYSSCHWCHVMAHESFEDETTASLMNNLFINIKVDREEYPDIDHMYMDAVQAMTGSGGWPLHVFLTADKKPFYGGTYFPKERMHGRASWKETLIQVSQFFTQNKDEVAIQADKLVHHLQNQSRVVSTELANDLAEDERLAVCKVLKNKIMANADTKEGGFGMAPKFPSTFSIKFLLDHSVLFEDKISLKQALLSLDKMRMGGLFDQLGGGFSRYSTDANWLAPHFEKMLYDNALLIEVYAVAFAITKNEIYKTVIHNTLQWLTREMMATNYGFYSAQDADSEGIEGKYYTWTSDELKKELGIDYDEFAKYYGVEEHGYWEHTNILHLNPKTSDECKEDFFDKLPRLNARLLELRSLRIKPLTDDKILLGWNALMNKALVNAYLYTGEVNYLDLAEKNMHFILENMRSDATLFYHVCKNGECKIAAYLDDLVYLAEAFIELGNAKANTRYYEEAKEIVEFIQTHFSNKEGSFFHYTHKDFQQVSINKTDIYDGALPSANAVLCRVYRKLGVIFHRDQFIEQSNHMLQSAASFSHAYPTSFAVWCAEWQVKANYCKEVSIIGKDAEKYYAELNTKRYIPNVSYIVSINENTIESLQGKQIMGETLIYICKNFTCLAPFKDVNNALTEI